MNQQYREEQERRKKRRKIIITVIVALFVFIATAVGFTIKYGFDYVKDTIIGHESKELLETKEWITSEYGAPGITITTPRVLERLDPEIPEDFKDKVEITMFGYGSLISNINIVVSTSRFRMETTQNDEENENRIDLMVAAEGTIKTLETRGVVNMIVKNEQFITPNGADGLKTFGTASFPTAVPNKFESGNYVLLGFTAENILQTVLLTWKEGDVYADEIIDRVLNSIELIKPEED